MLQGLKRLSISYEMGIMHGSTVATKAKSCRENSVANWSAATGFESKCRAVADTDEGPAVAVASPTYQ